MVRLICMPGVGCLRDIPWFFFGSCGLIGCGSASLKLFICNAASSWSQSPSPDAQCLMYSSLSGTHVPSPYISALHPRSSVLFPQFSSHYSSALSFCPQSIFFSPLSSVLIRFRIHIRILIKRSLLGKISIYGVQPWRALVLSSLHIILPEKYFI